MYSINISVLFFCPVHIFVLHLCIYYIYVESDNTIIYSAELLSFCFTVFCESTLG